MYKSLHKHVKVCVTWDGYGCHGVGWGREPAYREPLCGVHLDHAPQQVLAVGGDEVGHVEHTQLHLLQKVPQVVVVERQGALGGRGGRAGEEDRGGQWGRREGGKGEERGRERGSR